MISGHRAPAIIFPGCCNLRPVFIVQETGFPTGNLFTFVNHKPSAMKKLLFGCLIILITASGCRQVFGKRIRGNGESKTETRSVSGFHSIDVSGAIDVYVKQDSARGVKVETDGNLLEYIVTREENGVLLIHSRENTNLKPTGNIKVFVSGYGYRSFEASGACDIYSENKISSNEMINIDLRGASDVRLELHAPNVQAELSGAGTISLKGETKDLRINGSGSTNIKCFDMMAENVQLKISGAGDADVYASVKLDVRVSGAGEVKYRGNASVSQDVSGAGSVKKVD
jgi:hypothetical protein